MKLLTKEIIKKLPPLYSQENKKDPRVICKFFDPTSQWTWYVIEGQKQEDGDWLFFGYVIGVVAELGYFTLSEIQTAKQKLTGLRGLPIERDLYFTPCPLSKVRQEAKEF
jgi:hypothetical protein